MTQSTVTQNAIAMMSSDVNVGMNEVVSVFVSKYEDSLFAKKAVLSDKIRVKKQQLVGLDRSLTDSINPDNYIATVPSLGFVFKMKDVTIYWDGGFNTAKNTIRVDVGMYDMNGENKHHCVYTKTITVPIEADAIADRQLFKAELERLCDELAEVIGLIKSVSRKERQIRGRISEAKLAQSGMSDLLNDVQLIQLITVD